MKLVELFCGCGGFSRGAHAAGFEIAAAYDIDEVLTSSFSTNFPSIKLFHKDVALLTGEAIRDDVGEEVFGLLGGPLSFQVAGLNITANEFLPRYTTGAEE